LFPQIGFDLVEGTQDRVTVVKVLDHKYDHDITVNIQYDRGLEPTAAFEAGLPQGGAFLQQHVVALNFYPDLKLIKAAKLKKVDFIFIVDRSGSNNFSFKIVLGHFDNFVLQYIRVIFIQPQKI
jgi:hypothetical protein